MEFAAAIEAPGTQEDTLLVWQTADSEWVWFTCPIDSGYMLYIYTFATLTLVKKMRLMVNYAYISHNKRYMIININELVSTATWEVIRTYEFAKVSFSLDSDRLLVVGNRLSVVDTPTGEVVRVINVQCDSPTLFGKTLSFFIRQARFLCNMDDGTYVPAKIYRSLILPNGVRRNIFDNTFAYADKTYKCTHHLIKSTLLVDTTLYVEDRLKKIYAIDMVTSLQHQLDTCSLINLTRCVFSSSYVMNIKRDMLIVYKLHKTWNRRAVFNNHRRFDTLYQICIQNGLCAELAMKVLLFVDINPNSVYDLISLI